jgi:hypothetical protein
VNCRETRRSILDRHYAKRIKLVKKLERYYSSKSEEELRMMRAALVREQGMLGNIPLLASTTPIVFLVFGTQMNEYFPHDSYSWLIVAGLSVVLIVWSINHHFRNKGRVNLDAHLVDQILQERERDSQKSSPPVK